MDTLLRMQAWHDAYTMRLWAKEIGVKRFAQMCRDDQHGVRCETAVSGFFTSACSYGPSWRSENPPQSCSENPVAKKHVAGALRAAVRDKG
jgi:hypothetical protein